ncbi:RNA directed DNA polymerase reverse transcriptase, partial [Brachionus plicatilis]
MKLLMLGNRNRAEQSLSNQVINQIIYDKSIVGTLEMNSKLVSFVLDTGTVSTIVAKRIWDHCKTPDAALEPLDEFLETCVSGPVKVIGKGKCSVKLISFESEVEIIIVDELVSDFEGDNSGTVEKPRVRSFLGLANHYRRFFKGFAEKAGPLHEATEKSKNFDLNEKRQASFDRNERPFGYALRDR